MNRMGRVGGHSAVNVTVFLALSGLARVSAAQDVPVPANLQAAIFGKVFKYCSTLDGKKLEVAILAQSDQADLAASLDKGFAEARIPAVVVSSLARAEGSTVLYVTPGSVGAADAAKGRGMLTITGVESYVREGKVAVGVILAGKKPKILVHMKRLEAEGHKLSSSVLRVADIIR